MSLSIEGERIRGASATPKRCLDEWLLYSLGLFSIGDRAQTRITVSHRELSRSREGCNVGPCLTSSYISPHNRAPRQIPLFVHILCIVTRVSRGTQGARTTSGEYVLSFFPFLVRARHIPPFCAVHLQRSAPTLLRARFSVLRAKRAPRGLTAHQTLALTLDRSPFGRVFFDSAGSTPFHALPTPRISRFSQARDRERYIYI